MDDITGLTCLWLPIGVNGWGGPMETFLFLGCKESKLCDFGVQLTDACLPLRPDTLKQPWQRLGITSEGIDLLCLLHLPT